MLLTQYQKAMLSIVNESETKVFQQELLTIKIYPTLPINFLTILAESGKRRNFFLLFLGL